MRSRTRRKPFCQRPDREVKVALLGQRACCRRPRPVAAPRPRSGRRGKPPGPRPPRPTRARTRLTSPLNRSTDSILQVAGGLQRAGRDGRRGHRGKPVDLLQHRRDRVEILRPFEPFEVVPAFRLQFARLDQQEPASRRQIVGQVALVRVGPACRAGPRVVCRARTGPARQAGPTWLRPACILLRGTPAAQRRQVDRLQVRQAPLAGDLEPADRLDLVAEELDAHRVVPVGGEDVDDAAADARTRRAVPPPSCCGNGSRTIQPVSSSIDDLLPTPERAGLPGEGLAVGHGLDQGLDARNDQPRRLAALQRFEQADAVAKPLVVDHPFGRERLADGEPLGWESRERARDRRSGESTWSSRGSHDHQRPGRVIGQRGRRQRAGRPPDSVQSRRMARFQTLDDLREAFLVYQPPDQVQEPVGHCGIRKVAWHIRIAIIPGSMISKKRRWWLGIGWGRG